MRNQDTRDDDIAKSITGGTLFAVIFITLFLIAYAIVDKG